MSSLASEVDDDNDNDNDDDDNDDDDDDDDDDGELGEPGERVLPDARGRSDRSRKACPRKLVGAT